MTRTEFLSHVAVEHRTLEFWLAQAWIVPDGGADTPTFSDADLARGRLIQDLKTSLGVNDEGIDVALHLLDQLHGLRRAFEELRTSLSRGPDGGDANV